MNHAQALLMQAAAAANVGDASGALQRLRAAARVSPGNARILQAITEFCELEGDWPGVEAACVEWMACAPQDAQPRFLFGECRRADGDAHNAIAAYRTALALEPRHVGAHNNLAALLTGQGLADEALPHLRTAAQLAPAIAGVHYNLATALAGRGETGAAADSYRRVLQLDPGFASAHLNLGILLHAQGMLDESEYHLTQTASLAQRPALALANLGTVHKEQGRVALALADCVAAVNQEPDCLLGWSNLFVNAAYVDPAPDPAQLADWMRCYDRGWPCTRKETTRRARPARLRLGYVSADFRDHAVNYFFEPTLARHDRERFEIYCYDCNPRPDAVTARLRSTATT